MEVSRSWEVGGGGGGGGSFFNGGFQFGKRKSPQDWLCKSVNVLSIPELYT